MRPARLVRLVLMLPVLAAPALAQEKDIFATTTLDQVLARFETEFSGACWGPEGLDIQDREPETYELTYRESYEGDDAPPRRLRIYRLFCGSGAYNVQHVYYRLEEFDGLVPLAFPEPVFEVTYENDDYDGAVLDVTVTGFSAGHTLTNSDFDPQTGVFDSVAYWRGIGDASSVGRWRLVGPDAVLERFDVDASYDGEINPRVLVDFEEKGK